MRDSILAGKLAAQWSCADNLILHGRRVHILETSLTLVAILKHASAAHEGVQKTLHRLCADFHVSCDRRLVAYLVRTCSIYQRNKTETLHPAVLLESLMVPSST